MSAIVELAASIITLIIEVTSHAVVFIYLLIMAIFSQVYRQKLRAEWDTSNWQRFCMVFGVAVYSVALILALLIWTPFFSAEINEVAANGQRASSSIEIVKNEVTRMKKTKEIDQLVDVAGSIIKRKLAERKQEAGKNGGGQPATHSESK